MKYNLHNVSEQVTVIHSVCTLVCGLDEYNFLLHAVCYFWVRRACFLLKEKNLHSANNCCHTELVLFWWTLIEISKIFKSKNQKLKKTETQKKNTHITKHWKQQVDETRLCKFFMTHNKSFSSRGLMWHFLYTLLMMIIWMQEWKMKENSLKSKDTHSCIVCQAFTWMAQQSFWWNLLSWTLSKLFPYLNASSETHFSSGLC